GHDNLVNQVLVEVPAKDGGGCRNGVGRLTLIIQELEFHDYAPLPDSFSERRTTILPFLWPGTAPLTSSRPRSASTRTISRFCTVLVLLPIWPAIFLPRNTLPGSCA